MQRKKETPGKSAWQKVKKAFRAPETDPRREDGFVFVLPLTEEESHAEGDQILIQAATGKRPE